MKLFNYIVLSVLTLSRCSGQERKFEHVTSRDSSGVIVSEILTSDKGSREGTSNFYYPNGKLKDEVSYHNGRKTGWHTHYREDGVIEYKVSYHAGQQNGPGYWYDSAGMIELEGYWREAKQFGRFKWYHPDGAIRALDFHDFDGKVFCTADYPQPLAPPTLDGLVVSPGTWSSPKLDTLKVGDRTMVQVAFAEIPDMGTSIRCYWDEVPAELVSTDSLAITIALTPTTQGTHALRVEGAMHDKSGVMQLQNTFTKSVLVLP